MGALGEILSIQYYSLYSQRLQKRIHSKQMCRRQHAAAARENRIGRTANLRTVCLAEEKSFSLAESHIVGQFSSQAAFQQQYILPYQMPHFLDVTGDRDVGGECGQQVWCQSTKPFLAKKVSDKCSYPLLCSILLLFIKMQAS